MNAIKAAGPDKAKVRDALETTKDYVGTGGVVNMSATDHMGLDLTAFRMLEIKDGNWTLVTVASSSTLHLGEVALPELPAVPVFRASTAGAIYALVALGFSIIFNASGASISPRANS